MDFLDPKKKRAHKIRLYIGYALMVCALLTGSYILYYEARGFDRDWKTGEIIQNGLVFVDSHPESATVYVNGKNEGQTDARLTIPTGEYTFELVRDGYRTWKRTFKVEGSVVERLNYAFMFPNELQTSEVRSYANAPSFATQSPDRKWVVVQQPSKLNSFDLYDLSNQDNPVTTTFEVSDSIITASKKHAFEIVEWSNDNRRFIVKHAHDKGVEFILIDRERPAESLNLNRHLNAAIYQVAMRDKKYDKLHILDKAGGILSFADVKSRQTTKIAEGVFNYKSYGDDVIFYATSDGAKKGHVNANVIKGDRTHRVRELPVSPTYPLDITRYDDEWYLILGSPSEKKTYVYHEVFKELEKNPPLIPMPITIFRTNRVDNVSVSANTRFLAVQGGSEFAVYDAEHNRQYQYDIKLPIADQKVKWMDGHRFAANVNNQLVVWDFDGINQQTLVGAHPQFIPFFDRDYDFLYTLAPKTGGQSQFTKSPLRTPADL